jgi:branched-chain amino acid transport system ATP-binding protein
MATTTETNLLQVRDLHVYYGPAHVLQGVDLSVGQAAVSLIGRNGMGKTTLCQALMGLVPYRGSILFDGVELQGKKPHEIASAGIGYVPQGRRVFPSLSVHEHLRLVERRSNGGARWTIDGIYELFPRLAERKRSGGAQLSGGEQQMLAIGRALLTNPRLLVMDEPSEGLAPVIIDQLVQILRQLASEETGLLLVEQNLGVATGVSDQLAVMVTGKIALETTSRQLLADEESQRRFLGVSTHAEAFLEA